MESRRSRLQPVWVVLGLVCVCAASLPEITDKNFINECVEEHNRARTRVQPPANDMFYMSWDAALAITARAWAKRCVFEHNIYLDDAKRVHPNFSPVGENIWTGYPPSFFSVRRAVNDSWVGEKQHYNYRKNSCSGVCGHYTQVVWAKSYKVGCAAQHCPNGVKNTNFGDAVIFVCNYGPGGNVVGRSPYKSGGEACSGCRGSCSDKLCRSKERESQISYNWSPDWDPDSNNSVTVRPIALLATLLVAFAVHCY